ncbi:MAG TPA: hypothetical protein VIT41_10320 [Microlunatus sp.]
MAIANLTLDRSRLVQVALPLVVGALGCLLTYLTITSLNAQIEPVTLTQRLWGAADLARSLDPTDVPSFYTGSDPDALGRWLNTFSIALTLQQVGVVVGLVTLVALLMDEINKFFFWPLHVAGWVLVLSTVPLWLGAVQLGRLGVALRLGPGWLPLLLAGALVLVFTFRARLRIDTYGGV